MRRVHVLCATVLVAVLIATAPGAAAIGVVSPAGQVTAVEDASREAEFAPGALVERRGQDPGGPAPARFRNDTSFPDRAWWLDNRQGQREPTAYIGYCRDVWAHYYWMAVGENPANCTQGYVKFYSTRDSSYAGAMDVYRIYWHMDPRFTLQHAWNDCVRNFWCSLVVEAFILSKVKPVWLLIRKIRWGL